MRPRNEGGRRLAPQVRLWSSPLKLRSCLSEHSLRPVHRFEPFSLQWSRALKRVLYLFTNKPNLLQSMPSVLPSRLSHSLRKLRNGIRKINVLCVEIVWWEHECTRLDMDGKFSRATFARNRFHCGGHCQRYFCGTLSQKLCIARASRGYSARLPFVFSPFNSHGPRRDWLRVSATECWT